MKIDAYGVITFLIPAALAIIALRDYKVAKGLFVASALVLAAEAFYWCFFQLATPPWVMGSAFVVSLLLIAALLQISMRWTDARRGAIETTSGEVTLRPAGAPLSTPAAPPSRSAESHKTPRIFVDNISPTQFQQYFSEHVAVQAEKLVSVYIGKWLRVSGNVNNVMGDLERGVTVYFDGTKFSGYMVGAEFVGEHAERAVLLRRGDVVSIVGKISRIDGLGLRLTQCEIEENS